MAGYLLLGVALFAAYFLVEGFFRKKKAEQEHARAIAQLKKNLQEIDMEPFVSPVITKYFGLKPEAEDQEPDAE